MIDDRRVLAIFSEKVEKLDRYSFTKHIRENSIGFSFEGDPENGYIFALNGPGEEAVDAFALTLRMFLQDNDICSIHRLGGIYERLQISDVLKQQFAEARTLLNRFLQSPSRIELRGEELTNWTILETILYGLLAHTSVRKRAIADDWASDPIRFQVIYMEFLGIVSEILHFVLCAHEHNRHAIAEMDSSGGAR